MAIDVAGAVARAREKSVQDTLGHMRLPGNGWNESALRHWVDVEPRSGIQERATAFNNPRRKQTVHLYLRALRGEWELLISEPTYTEYLAKGIGLESLKEALDRHANSC